MELHAESNLVDVTDYEHPPADGLKRFEVKGIHCFIDDREVTAEEFRTALAQQ